ncbi:putative secreted protein with PEP-CTERM sorting signal [Paucimonas lemoignei]|uniref:Putative secreted protein with PEP-CTERM sorting signal n=1 Tax=Paucimonas lemoignei TaxID=29443 RepID=A0A4R3HTG7_PAULE|nr:PEP-CTERM sorting domain-containing protein [Paucimonas lemoignei]TCS36506.1 putative secreted protein with PEP-CTERM sorting signal [Paucimonas lemoignei]
MITQRLKSAVFLTALALAGLPASAATVTASISYDTLGLANTSWLVPASVTASNSNSVSLTASDLPPIPYYGNDLHHTTYMRATADSDISGVIGANTSLRAGGRVDAVSTWSDTFSNSTGDSQNYGFNIAIAEINLTLGGWTADLSTRDYQAGFSASVLVNGNSVWNTSQIFSQNGTGVHLTKSGFDIGTGITSCDENDIPRCFYELAPYTGTIDLGTFADGDIFSVSYIFSSFAYWNDPNGCSYECGSVGSQVLDPFGLTGGNRVVALSSTPGNSVPEPETYLLFLAGLGLMAGAMRSHKAKRK